MQSVAAARRFLAGNQVAFVRFCQVTAVRAFVHPGAELPVFILEQELILPVDDFGGLEFTFAVLKEGWNVSAICIIKPVLPAVGNISWPCQKVFPPNVLGNFLRQCPAIGSCHSACNTTCKSSIQIDYFCI